MTKQRNQPPAQVATSSSRPAVAFSMPEAIGPTAWVADYTSQFGRLGLSIFFAISGFLLYRPFVAAHLADQGLIGVAGAAFLLVVLAAFTAGVAIGVLGMVPRWWKHRKAAQRAPMQAPGQPSAQTAPAHPAEQGL